MYFSEYTRKSLIHVLISITGLLSLTACATTTDTTETTNYCSFDAAEVSHIQRNAEAGEKDAQYQVGQWYGSGSCLNQNTSVANEWYRKSGEQGHVNSQLKLATWYHHNGDMASAITWYRKAANAGDVYAARLLEKICRLIEECEWLAEEREQRAEERERLAKAKHAEEEKVAEIRKHSALGQFGTISIIWSPPEPTIQKKKAEEVLDRAGETRWGWGMLPIYPFTGVAMGLAVISVLAVGDAAVGAAINTDSLKSLEKVLEENIINQEFPHQLVRVMRTQLDNPVAMTENNPDAEEKSTDREIETIIKILDLRLLFLYTGSKSSRSDLSGRKIFQIEMQTDYQLINNSDQTVIYDQTLIYTGNLKKQNKNLRHTLSEWADDDARHFRVAIEQGYGDIADQIVKNILSHTSTPKVSQTSPTSQH